MVLVELSPSAVRDWRKALGLTVEARREALDRALDDAVLFLSDNPTSGGFNVKWHPRPTRFLQVEGQAYYVVYRYYPKWRLLWIGRIVSADDDLPTILHRGRGIEDLEE